MQWTCNRFHRYDEIQERVSLVRDLLYYHQDIPIGTVISGTEAGNGFYSLRLFPNYLFMMNIIQLLLKIFLKRQKISC